MDLMASCKEKLGQFRIKELKDVLTQLSLSKQGRKQDLVDRIILTLSVEPGALMPGKKNVIRKEDVAKLIDDTYRKMQGNGANDLATKAQAVSNCSNNVVVCKEEIEDSSYKIDKVRCPCGSTSQTESMIKCEDSRCHIWQHIKCVIIPEKPMEGVLPKPPDFFHCELCRLTRTDPFLVTISHPLYPVKLAITSVPTDGSNPVLSAEKNFQLTKLEKNLILKQEYDVQAWCMLLNDKVPFRLQWPQYADLQVNGMPVRAINRPGSQLLGTNGRDDGPIITTCTRDGINKISLTGCDTRVFCLGVRIVKRRTVQQIMNIIPSESNGELFEDAITRIRRCVGGGTAMENAESDSDIEVVAHFVTVSLRCPMSGSRMKVAGRFKPCVHMGCFDLDVFVEMNQRSRKWQCPVCLKNYSLENVIIDPYFNRITSKLRECGEDLTEIEVKPDGSWRGKGGSGEIGMWHNPDSSLCVSTEVDSKPTSEVMREVKQENSVLKLGMRKNENGIWEFRHKQQQGGGGVDSQMLSSGGGNIGQGQGQGQHDVIQMSSSVSGSGVKDCDDVSVNQDRNNDVIVLSDSDDDEVEVDVDVDVDVHVNPPLNSTSTNNNITNQYSHEIPEIYLEDPVTSTVNVNGNGNDDEYAMHMWTSLPPSVGQQGLDLFGSDDINFPPLQSLPLGDFTTETNTTNTNNVMGDSSSAEPNDDDDDMCDGLVSNSSLAEAFDTSDPSLQMYLPPPLPPLPPLTTTITTTRQQSEEEETDVTFQPQIPSEDWISLRLGGDNNTNPSANATNGEVDEEGTLDSLAHTASLLGGGSMNDNNNNNKNVKQSRQRSDGPFSFPQKRRSVRPRYLSIDSDSD